MRKFILSIVFLILVALGTASFLFITLPAGEEHAAIQKIEVKKGESARSVAANLEAQGVIRSSSGFYILSAMTGAGFRLKPGVYELSPSMSIHAILDRLVQGPDRERTVLVREGDTIFDVDVALATAGVLPKGTLIDAQASSTVWLEGRLFPDTYRFNVSSTVEEVTERFEKNFEAKALPLLNKDQENFEQNLILASLLEREVPEIEDRQIVAGILLKRIEIDMAIQVDATICYIKELRSDGEAECYPLLSVDLAQKSAYNTYTNRGWPPHPIGNPGASAIEAALNPKKSPYWYYLSDPATQKTIFATTLDEHAANRVKYLAK